MAVWSAIRSDMSLSRANRATLAKVAALTSLPRKPRTATGNPARQGNDRTSAPKAAPVKEPVRANNGPVSKGRMSVRRSPGAGAQS